MDELPKAVLSPAHEAQEPGTAQLSSIPYDQDRVYEDFLEIRYYYQTSTPTDENLTDWELTGEKGEGVEGSDGNEFITSWDTIESGFGDADGVFPKILYHSESIYLHWLEQEEC